MNHLPSLSHYSGRTFRFGLVRAFLLTITFVTVAVAIRCLGAKPGADPGRLCRSK